MDEGRIDPRDGDKALRGEVHESRSRLVKGLLMAAGTVSVGLGVLGIIFPVVPTTPFLLLAAACYAHSSERFYVGLLTNRYFGQYIRDWREKRGLTLATKLWIIFVMAGTMGASAVFFVPLVSVRIFLGIVGACVSIYIWRLPTKPRDSVEKDLD
ncbi:MAG: YbaN family protein [Candidatus Hydrogenedentes bacterium]|nr:YbaN family protein [Candidatus Hydrogenedentota bacterium]